MDLAPKRAREPRLKVYGAELHGDVGRQSMALDFVASVQERQERQRKLVEMQRRMHERAGAQAMRIRLGVADRLRCKQTRKRHLRSLRQLRATSIAVAAATEREHRVRHCALRERAGAQT